MSDAARHRLQRLEELFAAAKELPAERRAAWLEQQCSDDAALRAEVAALLVVDDDAGARGLLEQAADPWLGRTIERWRILERIGAGGMGVVYRAARDDGAFEQQVALKLLKHGVERAEAFERFRRERQLLAALSHPNIARLIDGGATAEGVPYLVMELVAGTRLDRWCDERQLPIEARLRLFLDVCAAVQHAHQRLVIHRDLKPSNVLVGADGTAKLLDFGIAKLLEAEDGSEAPRTRERRLTPEYASPELVRGAPVTVASDVFSLGVMLHELLTGSRPWRDSETSASDLERAICETTPPKPSATAIDAAAARARGEGDPARLRRRLRGDLDAIVGNAIAPEAERRYGSVEQFAHDVRRHLAHEPIVARPPGFLYLTAKFIRRRRALAAALLVALLALATGAAGLLHGQREAQRKADAAARVNQLLREMLVQLEPTSARGFGDSLNKQLKFANDELEKGLLKDEPALEAELRIALGRVYGSLGYAGWSVQQFEKAQQIADAHGVLDPRQRLELVRWLGWAERNAARYAASIDHLQQALALCDTLADTAETRIWVANDLALSYTTVNRFAEADALLRATIDELRAAGGAERSQMAGLQVAQALNSLQAGDAKAAEAPARAALALTTTLLPEADPRFCIALDTLGRVLRALEQWSEAEALFERSLEIRRELFDSMSPNIAWSLALLGELKAADGRSGEAVPLFEEALAIRTKHYATDSPARLSSLLQLGLALIDAGEADAALPHLQTAITIADTRGHADPRLARGRSELNRLRERDQ